MLSSSTLQTLPKVLHPLSRISGHPGLSEGPSVRQALCKLLMALDHNPHSLQGLPRVSDPPPELFSHGGVG